jgi:hypothetical protein
MDFWYKQHRNKVGSIKRRTPQTNSETDCSENPSPIVVPEAHNLSMRANMKQAVQNLFGDTYMSLGEKRTPIDRSELQM